MSDVKSRILSRAVFLLALCLLLPFFSPLFARAEADEAQDFAAELTKSVELSLTSEQNFGSNWKTNITDNNVSNKIKLNSPAELTLSSDTGIAGLYMIWDAPPGAWQIDTGAETIACGQNGFAHEYIKLADNPTALTLRLPAGAVLCDIRVFGEGKLPGDVQLWQPPYQKADMLLLPTHADDEHLYFGGTMPYYGGELGMRVQVVYMINHSLPTAWSDSRRIHELLNGLWTVGIAAYPVIADYPDLQSLANDYTKPEDIAAALAKAKTQYNAEDWVRFQVTMIRRFKPYVILGHDINGEYGHGAHILNTDCLIKALEFSADPEYDPASAEEYGLWDVPKTYLHLWRENKVSMNWDIPLERFGGKTAFQMAEAGYACHVSQHIYGLAVRRSGVSDCRAFGLYRSTVGPDIGGGDFFENIDFKAYEPEETTAPPEETTIPPVTTELPADTTAGTSEQSTTAAQGGTQNGLSRAATGALLLGGIVILSLALVLTALLRKQKASR